MHWSDERYVKLYSRDTAAWLMWPWQARALLPLLLRKADGAGLLDLGKRDQLAALSVLVGLPSEVVEPGLAALLEDGTLEPVERGFLLPGFIDAQEATKTESRKKRDQRERQRDQARETTRAHVPQCPAVSPSVPLQPSPAQPSSAQIEEAAPAAPPLVLVAAEPESLANRLAAIWNEAAPEALPRWRGMPPDRAKAAKARLREAPDLERWRRAIAGMATQPFLLGSNDRGWRAGPDWLLRPGTLTKLEEGTYQDTKHRNDAVGPEVMF